MMEDIAREREEDKLHQFLMGIDDSLYGAVKFSLPSRTPLPSLDEAYNILIQDEESKSLARLHEDKTAGVSFAVQTQTRSRQSVDTGGGSLVCTLCGKNGHLAENYFKKIGYPAWWGKRTRNKPGFSSAASSGNTGARPKSDSARANHVAAEASHANYAITSVDRVGFSGLSDTQWKTLVHMLNDHNHKVNSHSGTLLSESWINDTGASNHMTGSIDYLTDLRDMAPMLIKLPDGRFTTSTKHGSVSVGSSLTLHNVFFVDGVHCHLISVSSNS